MTDREKVIKGLECCRFDDDGIHWCAECPYQASEEEKHHLDWNCHIAEMVNDIKDLLKAQEPVEAYVRAHGTGFESATSWWYACRNCHEPIDPKDKFCRHCGRAVKWDDSD